MARRSRTPRHEGDGQSGDPARDEFDGARNDEYGGAGDRASDEARSADPAAQWKSVLIGGVVTALGSLLLPIVGQVAGGAVAGHLRGSGRVESALVGGLAAIVGTAPPYLLFLGAVSLLLSPLGPDTGVTVELFSTVVVVYLAGLVFAGVLGAVGGLLGSVLTDRSAPGSRKAAGSSSPIQGEGMRANADRGSSRAGIAAGGVVAFLGGLVFPVASHVAGGAVAGYLRGGDEAVNTIDGGLAAVVSTLPGLVFAWGLLYYLFSPLVATVGELFLVIALVTFFYFGVVGFAALSGAVGGLLGGKVADR